MASTTVFGESSVSLHPGKSQYYASDATLPRLQGYESYLASGPNSAGHGQDIELSRLDSMNEPLLTPGMMYYQNQGAVSQGSIATPPSLYQEQMTTGGLREAPLHRPQGSYQQHSIHDSPEPHYQELAPGGYGQPQQYPPQQYHQQQPSGSQFSQRPGPPNSQPQRNMSPALNG
jgi:hypothetical protein